MNGTTIEGSRDLRNAVGLVRVGGEVAVEVWRGQGKFRVDIRVVDEQMSGARIAATDSPPALRGATLRDLEPGDRVHGRIEGVIVAAVEPQSRAARNGIRPGDVIVAVNQRRVRNTDDLENVFERIGGVLALNIVRGNSQLLIVIR